MNQVTNPFEKIDFQLSEINSQLAQLYSVVAATQSPEKRFYSIKQAAEKLSVAPITLYRNIQAGKIPSKKVGMRVMVPSSYVEQA